MRVSAELKATCFRLCCTLLRHLGFSLCTSSPAEFRVVFPLPAKGKHASPQLPFSSFSLVLMLVSLGGSWTECQV